MTNEIEKQFIDMLHKELPGIEIEISMETNLIQAGVNSISFIKLVILIENEFNISFDEERLDISYFPTIKDIVGYIESELNKNNSLEKKNG
ncbi:acyl carrier protein [Paenibacillus polysaccharolyticus]|uniref:acyl carrier protein n=1 Tax=Paenibacillus polysaccharolyticus TaxID=582692 RepID=UPI00209FB734|nr:acyl carrier protein [Paenibacillus polysaccharolyticus]MCP1132763.1 acyl carrier protein [Paenibacillus polysaccharolyticus]